MFVHPKITSGAKKAYSFCNYIFFIWMYSTAIKELGRKTNFKKHFYFSFLTSKRKRQVNKTSKTVLNTLEEFGALKEYVSEHKLFAHHHVSAM